MTVNKRTRFEVLKRDGFRCYYCGTRGNETTGEGLTIDHVVPVALNGSDDPENLVAACADCNSGKTSIPADAALIARVDQDAARYKAARKAAMEALALTMDDQSEYEDRVVELWQHYSPGYRGGLPAGYAASIYTWHSSGVPLTVIEKGIRIAMSNPGVPWSAKWAYVHGVVKNTLKDSLVAAAVVEAVVVPEHCKRGRSLTGCDPYGPQRGKQDERDLLTMLIDGRTDDLGWKMMQVTHA